MIRIPIKLYYKNNGTLFTQGYLNKVPFINKLSNYAYDLFLVTPANDNTIVKVAFEKGDGTTTSEYPMAKVNTEEVKVGTNLETWTIFKYSLEDSILDISNSNHKNKLGIGFTVLEKEIVPKLMPSGETVQEEVFHSLTYEPYNATCNYAIVGSQRAIEDTPFQVIMDYLNEMLNTKLNIKDGITKVAKLPPIVTDNTLPTYNLNYAYILTQEDTPHMLGDIVVAKASGYETLVYGKQYIDSYKLGTQGQIDLILERLDSVESTASSNFTDINQVIKPDIANLKEKDTQLESKINTNTSSIETLDTKVDNNKVELDRKISGLDARVGANETNIGKLETRVGTNENDIAMAKSDIEQAQSDINTNRTNIAKKLDKNYSTLALRNEIADTDLIPILRVGSDTPNKITGADLKRILGNAKDHFKGDYLTEEALNQIVGEAGDFAYVNEVGKAPVLYLWDSNDNAWAKTDTSQFVTQAVFDDYKNLNDAEVAKKLDKVSNEEYVVYGTGRKDGASGQAPQRTIQYNQQPYGNGIVQRMGDGRVKGTTATEDNDLTNLKQVNGLLANAKAIVDVAELPTQDINENVIYRVTKEVKTQPVAVPKAGFVKEFYFNTSLSVDEVVTILKTLNLEEGYYALCTILDQEAEENFRAIFMQYAVIDGVENYLIFDEGGNGDFYFSSSIIPDIYGADFVGWKAETTSTPIVINQEVVDHYPFGGIPSGTDNEKLKNLMSITPFGKTNTYQEYYVNKNGTWERLTNDAYSLASKIEGSSEVAADVNEAGDKLNLHLDTHFKETLATKEYLKYYTYNYYYKGDISSNEFYQWCVNTPGVDKGAWFSVQLLESTEMATDRGFPVLEEFSTVYGFYDMETRPECIVLITEKGLLKIINGTAQLTCEIVGGSKLTPATATELGGVKVGSGLNVTADGTLSASGGAGDKASVTDSTLQFETAVDSKVISANNGEATTDTLRTLKVGNTNYKVGIGNKTETWTFTLEDGSIVTKEVVLK